MRKLFVGFVFISVLASSQQAAHAYSSDYYSFMSVLKQTYSKDPKPYSQSNVKKFGGRNSFCVRLEKAAELDAGVTLTPKKAADFVAACNNFLKSKGIK